MKRSFEVFANITTNVTLFELFKNQHPRYNENQMSYRDCIAKLRFTTNAERPNTSRACHGCPRAGKAYKEGIGHRYKTEFYLDYEFTQLDQINIMKIFDHL